MAEQPLVSVVTPSFNTARYIGSTLASVAAQDHPAVEHIVVDGGSDDGTVEILRRQSGVEWVSEPDRGQSHALNKGFAKARGEFIGWLNSDDVYTEGAISRGVAYLNEHPEVDMIYTDLQIIDAEDRVYGFTNGRPFSLETLLVNNPVKQPTLLMRRRVIDRLKGVDERLHYTMDREFWLRMHMAGFTIRYIPGWVNARFRLVEGTKTHTHTPRFRQEWLQVMEQAFREEFFRTVDSALLRRAIRVNRSSYELSLMNRAFDGGRRGRGLVHAANALFRDASLAFNAGFLGLLAKGLGGGDRDPTAKFKVGR